MHDAMAATAPALTALLLPCPFCGAPARLEPDPWQDASARVACAGTDCAVRPRTEYLLLRFADELVAAWNQRGGPPASAAPQDRGDRESAAPARRDRPASASGLWAHP